VKLHEEYIYSWDIVPRKCWGKEKKPFLLKIKKIIVFVLGKKS